VKTGAFLVLGLACRWNSTTIVPVVWSVPAVGSAGICPHG